MCDETPNYNDPAQVAAVLAGWPGTPDQKAYRWYGTPKYNGVIPPPLGFTTDEAVVTWIANNYTAPTG